MTAMSGRLVRTTTSTTAATLADVRTNIAMPGNLFPGEGRIIGLELLVLLTGVYTFFPWLRLAPILLILLVCGTQQLIDTLLLPTPLIIC